MVLLASRIPLVERVVGQDRLIGLHRRLAPWPLVLISLHVWLLTVGYAQAARSGVWHEASVLVRTFPDVGLATLGFALMAGIGLISIRQVRTRIPREKWWAIHLLMYVALAVSFAHVIALGPSFVGHPLTRILWSALWVLTAGSVVTFRMALPLVRSLRHRLRVVEVRPEGPGVVSIIMKGRRVDQLEVAGGQFFEWRFLTPGMWWQAHPFTMSAMPKSPYLRLTVKGLGDFSRELSRVPVGTKVAIEGPYGTFTKHVRRRKKAVLIAGGIGVTAARALLEDLPSSTEPVVVLRAPSANDLVLAREIDELARKRRGRVHHLVGSRNEVDLSHLGQIVPDIATRDVFVSGSPAFVNEVRRILRRMGVPTDSVHHEEYAL
jgi:predicted ferric reductase